MANRVRFYETGAPDVLRYEQVEVGEPGPGEVRVRHQAVGLNMADCYFRTGMYPAPLPSGIGVEGSGTIEAVGAGVSGFAVGERVTYTGSPLGAYSDVRNMPTASLIKLPDGISCETAAAMTMRGLTSAYLMRAIYRWQAGDTFLLHAAAGGVGLIVCQWAKLLGLNVIGTVSSEEKGELAKAHGCDHIIYYRREDVAKRVRELTGGEGVKVVIDSVGKDTFQASLNSLRRRGTLIGVGTSSGAFPPIDALQLAMRGSLYFTRPALADYIADPMERAELSGELFGHVLAGRIKIGIHQRYTLDNAVQAHRDLEGGRTTGSSIFVL